LLAGVAALAVAGAAAAEDFDGWGWTRTELPHGGMVWIASQDIESARHGAPVIRVLRTTSPRPGRYLIDEFTFACGGGVSTRTLTFGNDGPGPEPEPRPEREVRFGGVEGDLYNIACEGDAPLTDIEVGSAREAIEYHAMAEERGWNPPARTRSWDSGPGGPDREPVEAREPPPPDGE